MRDNIIKIICNPDQPELASMLLSKNDNVKKLERIPQLKKGTGRDDPM